MHVQCEIFCEQIILPSDKDVSVFPKSFKFERIDEIFLFRVFVFSASENYYDSKKYIGDYFGMLASMKS